MEENEQKKSKINLLIVLLIAIIIVAVGITVWALFFRENSHTLAPDYAPQEEEVNAERIPGDEEGKMEQPEGGSSVSLSYAKDVTINLSDETAELYFANPNKSNQDMVLQIVIEDEVIVQSGTLKPGNQVKSLNLLNNTAKMLKAGGYEGKFVVLYYHSETGEKAVVNTEIPINITVRD